MTKLRNTLVVVLLLPILAVLGLAVIQWQTSTPNLERTGSQVTFKVTWTQTAPVDVQYQIGGNPWVDVGSMGTIEQHKGWISDPLPYSPRTTYRLKVIQYDRSDNTQAAILVDGHLQAGGGNQHPSRTITQIELRSG